MRIGELSSVCGLPTRTIRFYERRGLLPAPTRSTNGYRTYTRDDLGRLEFIRNAQSAGLTLNEIASVTALRDTGTTPCTHVNALLDAKLTDVKDRIDQLVVLQDELQRIVKRARTLDPANCTERDVCHIIQPGTARVSLSWPAGISGGLVGGGDVEPQPDRSGGAGAIGRCSSPGHVRAGVVGAAPG